MGCRHHSPKDGEGTERGREKGRDQCGSLSLGGPQGLEVHGGILVDALAPVPPQEPQPGGFDNKAFLTHDGEANWAPAPSPEPCPTSDEAPPEPLEPTPLEPAPPAPPSLVPPACVPESPMAAQDGGSPAEVRSILTKERRPEGGYKAVWFGEDIGAEADVVVLNVPTSDADGAGDWDSQGGGAAEGAPSDGPSDSTND